MCAYASAVHDCHAMTYDVQDLRKRVAGEVCTPDDERWEAARQTWNLSVDQQPELVVLPESADDVVAVVEFAQVQGLRIAPETPGPMESLTGTILVIMSRVRKNAA